MRDIVLPTYYISLSGILFSQLIISLSSRSVCAMCVVALEGVRTSFIGTVALVICQFFALINSTAGQLQLDVYIYIYFATVFSSGANVRTMVYTYRDGAYIEISYFARAIARSRT